MLLRNLLSTKQATNCFIAIFLPLSGDDEALHTQVQYTIYYVLLGRLVQSAVEHRGQRNQLRTLLEAIQRVDMVPGRSSPGRCHIHRVRRRRRPLSGTGLRTACGRAGQARPPGLGVRGVPATFRDRAVPVRPRHRLQAHRPR